MVFLLEKEVADSLCAVTSIISLSPRTSEVNIGAFLRDLHELGYVEGQNIALEVRSAEGDNRRLPALRPNSSRSNQM